MKQNNLKLKKWEISLKPGFWQQNHRFIIGCLIGIVFFFAVTVTLWIGTVLGLSGAKNVMYPVASVVTLLSFGLLVLCLRFVFLRVIVDLKAQTITVKGAFGIVTQCQISKIEKINSTKALMARVGRIPFIVIRDGRGIAKRNKPNEYYDVDGFSQKGCYVGFQHTEKTEKIVKMFWKRPIGEE